MEGDINDPRTVPFDAVTVVGEGPGVLRDPGQDRFDGTVDGEPDRVGKVPGGVGEPVKEPPTPQGAAGRVGADQHLPARPKLSRQLLERIPRHLDVICGGVVG